MSVNLPRITSTLRPAGSLGVATISEIEPVVPPTFVLSGLPRIPFYSFDLQQTGIAPLNKALPEFNTVRFS